MLRILVLLFAVVMMAAGAGKAHAAPDVGDAGDVGDVATVLTVVDDDGDPATPTPVEMVVVDLPENGPAVLDVPRAPVHGRAHVALVFRPPRAFASR